MLVFDTIKIIKYHDDCLCLMLKTNHDVITHLAIPAVVISTMTSYFLKISPIIYISLYGEKHLFEMSNTGMSKYILICLDIKKQQTLSQYTIVAAFLMDNLYC